MTQFIERYYPTICIRRAEMKALEMLPPSEKVRMLPIVLLAPWLNSIEFSNTYSILERSIGMQPIIVDFDRYFRSNSSLPSREFFRSLLGGENFLDSWSQVFTENTNYIPTIQFVDKTPSEISAQIDLARAWSRGFVFRLERDFICDLDLFFETIDECAQDDILVVFDSGYVNDPLTEAGRLSGLIGRLLNVSPDLRFVVSSSNFPNDFSEFDDFSHPQPIAARQLFDSLRGQYGNYRMYYGDWASTKPRRYDGGGGRPLPRIDFPTTTNWIIARSKEEQWDFQQAAERITRLPEWQTRPQIWGSGMIEKTARALPNGINTGPQAIACRVNIHLFVQNNFGSAGSAAPPSSEWIDPI